MILSESNVPLLRSLWIFLLAFAQSLTEFIYTFTMNNTITRIFVVYLLTVWKITSCCLSCICCLLALFVNKTPVSWIVKTIVLYVFSVLLMAVEVSIVFPPQRFLSHASTCPSQSWSRPWSSPRPFFEPILVPGMGESQHPRIAKVQTHGFHIGKVTVPCSVLYSFLCHF